MAKKKFFDENGNEVKAKAKKPFYKKVWFWAIIVIIFIAGAFGGGTDEASDSQENDTEVASESSTPAEPVENEEETEEVEQEEEPDEEVTEETETEEVVEESEPEEEVSREFANALKSAENYTSIMAFSEKGLYDQLTSEHGEGYPAEAAQYAMDNIDVDWNEQALKSAKNYQETMPMSDSSLYDQLVSESGEGFTPEQAQYAIDNLD